MPFVRTVLLLIVNFTKLHFSKLLSIHFLGKQGGTLISKEVLPVDVTLADPHKGYQEHYSLSSARPVG